MSKVGNILAGVKTRYDGLDSRRKLAAKGLAAFAVLALILLGGALLFQPNLSETEEAAVQDSAKAAKGFEKDSDAYSFTQLNKAVEYAQDNKCTEARAIYSDAIGHKNGLPDADIKLVKDRIEDICSGKAESAPKPNLL